MNDQYSEDQLVEQTAIALLAGMDWETLDCYNEFDQGSSPLGRENRGEVVLTKKVTHCPRATQPQMSSTEAIDGAIEELTKSRAVMNLAEANYEIYRLLKDGVKVTITEPRTAKGKLSETLKVIDWENPENNDFFLASQLWIAGEMYTPQA